MTIGGRLMKTLRLRDAKASFSSVVEAAEQGDPTIITKHGRPVAMLVPLKEGRSLYPDASPSLADLLLAIPADPEVVRDRSSARDLDL